MKNNIFNSNNINNTCRNFGSLEIKFKDDYTRTIKK